jgi:D-xylose transport system substrate-binding protein
VEKMNPTDPNTNVTPSASSSDPAPATPVAPSDPAATPVPAQDITPPIPTTPAGSATVTPDPSAPATTAPASPLPVSSTPKKSKRKWLVLGLVALVVVAAAAYWLMHGKAKPAAPATSTAPTLRVGFSMDTLKELRWQKDKQYMTDNAAKMGVQLTTLIANGDDKQQVADIENLISQKVDVLIVVPHNSAAVAPELAKAHAAGIKVLSYDRLILGGDVDYYVSFDNTQVGVNEAKYVVDHLPAGKVAKVAYVAGAPTDNNATQITQGVHSVVDPLVKAGKIQLVYEKPTDDWLPDNAYNGLKAFLATNKTVDGVICANDSTAFGAIHALQEVGLDGKVPVTGQDADLTAIKRLIVGTQTMTNYKSIKELTNRAMIMAVDIAKKKAPETNATTDNQLKKVPSYLLQPTPVTKDNIKDTVIKDGFYTEQEVYGS